MCGNSPLVSVVIPVYNVEKYVGECVDSVLRQTYTRLEVIIADDASSDSSCRIAERYAACDSRVRVLHCEHGGPSSTRNAAISEATGDLLFFVDGDDIVPDDAVELLLEMMQSTGADVVCGGFRRFAEVEQCEMRLPRSGKCREYSPREAIAETLYQTNGADCSAWGKLYKADLFESVRFPVGIYYEDLATFAKIYEKSSKVAITADVVYFYRRRAESIIGHFSSARIVVLDVVDEIEKRYEGDGMLLPAAQDRVMSANFNMLMLADVNGCLSEELSRRCCGNIRRLRWQSLKNPRVRLKNKLGVLVSFLGEPLLRFVLRTFGD